MCIQEAAILDVLFKAGRGGGGLAEATSSTTSPDLTGLLVKELGLCAPSRSGSVCLTDRLAASASLLLPSQRILFSTAQMFRAVCCTALSCVYNKEVLVWRRREGSEVGEYAPLRRGGGHCAVGVNTEGCQLSPGPPTSQYSISSFPLFLPAHLSFLFSRGTDCVCMLAERVRVRPAGEEETH